MMQEIVFSPHNWFFFFKLYYLGFASFFPYWVLVYDVPFSISIVYVCVYVLKNLGFVHICVFAFSLGFDE